MLVGSPPKWRPHVYNITHFPKALGYIRGHWWRHTEGLMNAHEIIVHREQRNRTLGRLGWVMVASEGVLRFRLLIPTKTSPAPT
jgi:hypothetical protein